MFGRYSVSDIMGRVYWRTDDLRDLYLEAKWIAFQVVDATTDLLICRDETTGRTVYLWNGQVSTYAKNENLNYLEGVR